MRQILNRRGWWHRSKACSFVKEDEDRLQSESVSLIWTSWRQTDVINQLKNSSTARTLIYNRLEDNFHLANKKALFANMCSYYQGLGLDPFKVAIPLTFHIKNVNDSDYNKFLREFKRLQKIGHPNLWIIKPGENSNRGCGIEVADTLCDIKSLISDKTHQNHSQTSIV